MPCKTRQLAEALLAVRAVERSLATVGQQVPVEDLELGEALSTFCAGKCALPGMDLPVLIQKPHMRETFPTLTRKRPLPCVFHLVSLEI